MSLNQNGHRKKNRYLFFLNEDISILLFEWEFSTFKYRYLSSLEIISFNKDILVNDGHLDISPGNSSDVYF